MEFHGPLETHALVSYLLEPNQGEREENVQKTRFIIQSLFYMVHQSLFYMMH